MGRTACTEPQCLYKGDLYLFFYLYGVTHLNSCAVALYLPHRGGIITFANSRSDQSDELKTCGKSQNLKVVL